MKEDSLEELMNEQIYKEMRRQAKLAFKMANEDLENADKWKANGFKLLEDLPENAHMKGILQ